MLDLELVFLLFCLPCILRQFLTLDSVLLMLVNEKDVLKSLLSYHCVILISGRCERTAY